MKRLFISLLGIFAIAGCMNQKSFDLNVVVTEKSHDTYTSALEVSVGPSMTKSFDSDLKWTWQDTDKIYGYQVAGDNTVNTMSFVEDNRFSTSEFIYSSHAPKTFHFIYAGNAIVDDTQSGTHGIQQKNTQSGIWTPVAVGSAINKTLSEVMNDEAIINMKYISSALEVRLWKEGIDKANLTDADKKNIVNAILWSENVNFLLDAVPAYNPNGTVSYYIRELEQNEQVGERVWIEGINSPTVVFNIAPHADKYSAGDLHLDISDENGYNYTLDVPALNFIAGQRSILNVEWRTPKLVTCADVIAGPVGKSFRVKGSCKSITNSKYGNWYLKDDTGEIHIYGTLDKKGATGNFLSLGIEAGDIVEVSGPKTAYGNTIELVDVSVHSITKSLIKLDATSKTLDKEGGEFVLKAAYKGNDVLVNIPEETSEWVSLLNKDYVKGIPTNIEPEPSDTVYIKFAYQSNMASIIKRIGSVIVSSNNGKYESIIEVALTQNSNEPAKVAIKDCFTQEYTHIFGEVMAVAKDYGFIVSDGTADILIYKSDYTAKARTSDKVKVLGAPSLYNWAAQIQGPDSVEKDGYNKDWKLPTPTVYDAAKINALIEKLTGTNKSKDRLLDIEYVSYTGTLKIDGNYINVIFPDGVKGQGSLKLSSSLKKADVEHLNGKNVKVTGYLYQVSASKDVPKFLNVIADKIEEVK